MKVFVVGFKGPCLGLGYSYFCFGAFASRQKPIPAFRVNSAEPWFFLKGLILWILGHWS